MAPELTDVYAERTKLFSLRWLDFSPAELRIVVLQDTNLRVPHAVLAVAERLGLVSC